MTGEERRQAMLRQRGEHRRAENKAQEEQRLNKRRMILEQTQKRLKKQKRMKLLKKFGIPGVLAVILLVVLVLVLKSCGEKNSGGNGGKELPAAETGLSREAGMDDAEETTQAEELPALPGREEISVVRIPVEPPTAAPTTASVTQVYQVTAAPAPESEPAAAAAQGPYQDPSGILVPSWITQAMIHVNPVSRPAIALDSVDYIVIHYVGNPGSTAMGNREYFDSLDNPAVEGAGRQASAQLIVGLEGEVIQCLPLNELAYATGNADLNRRTISIEVCHPDWEGKFSDVTYNSLVKLTAWLLQQEGLTPDRLLRHHDCSGKLCPRYYVEHPEAWEQLKADIAAYYYNHPNIQ